MTQPIPFTSGLEPRVLASAFVAGCTRVCLETPMEYAKVKRQTGQTWEMKNIYKGFGVGVPRNTFLLMVFFSYVDSFRRHTTLMESKLGQFFVSGSGSAVAWGCVWPLEIAKNLA